MGSHGYLTPCGVVALCCSSVVAAAQQVPKVDLVYPGPNGSVLDRLVCPQLTKSELDQRSEAIRRLPEFQANWDKEGPIYFGVLSREVGLAYPSARCRRRSPFALRCPTWEHLS